LSLTIDREPVWEGLHTFWAGRRRNARGGHRPVLLQQLLRPLWI